MSPKRGLLHRKCLCEGVIGVAATGWMIEGSNGLSGWWKAFFAASVLCVASSGIFLSCARGDRIFGDTDAF